jgi:elongation factor Ts
MAMAEVTASMVKALRDQTGAGMMDCKAALGESQGEIEAAIDWLRKKGLAKAAKKAGRVAAEGLVGVLVQGTQGAVVEVNSETDFVARNEDFQNLVRQIASLALAHGGDKDKTAAAKLGGQTAGEAVTALVAKIGENLSFRRSAGLKVEEGVVAAYVHNQTAPGLGKIGVLVALESKGDKTKLEALAKQIAMHVAAANPLARTEGEIDPALVARERDVLTAKQREAGKKEDIIPKIVEGGIKKFYEEVVLLHQLFVLDGKTKIADVLKAAEKDAGAPIALTGFARYMLGEGIEKETSDFAAEVAKAASSS